MKKPLFFFIVLQIISVSCSKNSGEKSSINPSQQEVTSAATEQSSLVSLVLDQEEFLIPDECIP